MADDPAPSPTVSPELAAIRARLDSVDLQLVQLLAARGSLIDEVIRTKRSQRTSVVDRAREDAMLDRIEVVADAEGLVTTAQDEPRDDPAGVAPNTGSATSARLSR